MSLNQYLATNTPTLPTLETDGWCVSPDSPLLSQIKAVLILPIGLDAPDDWAAQADVEGAIDNTRVGNTAGKWLIGWGELPEPENITTSLGRAEKIHCHDRYTMLLNVLVSDQNEAFLRSLQGNWKGFRFWFYTLGGRFVGGSTGICPHYVWPSFSYSGTGQSVEGAALRIEWKSDAAAPRTYLPGLFGNAIDSQSTTFEVSVYRQNYSSQSSAELIWTENGGALNAPFANNVWVIQNGQKLNPDLGQYTVNANSGPGQSTITINGNTHFSGSNYEIYTFVPAS